jgi:hypothetical protein
MKSTKRKRDDEFDEKAYKDFIQFKKFQASKTKPEPEPVTGIRTSSDLLKEFNTILSEILHEDGFRLDDNKIDKLRVFTGQIDYPNMMNLELQESLLAVKGVERISYDYKKGHMVIRISWTDDKVLRLTLAAEDHIEAAAQRQQLEATKQGDLVYYSLKSFLDIDSSTLPVSCIKKTVSDEISIVEVVVGVKSPVKDHQLEKVKVDQSKKLHSIGWGAHHTLPTLFLVAEIFSNPSVTSDTAIDSDSE